MPPCGSDPHGSDFQRNCAPEKIPDNTGTHLDSALPIQEGRSCESERSYTFAFRTLSAADRQSGPQSPECGIPAPGSASESGLCKSGKNPADAGNKRKLSHKREHHNQSVDMTARSDGDHWYLLTHFRKAGNGFHNYVKPPGFDISFWGIFPAFSLRQTPISGMLFSIASQVSNSFLGTM